jgi:hypothetical protein
MAIITVSLVLLIAGFIALVLSYLNKCPLWIAVLFLYIIALLNCLPLK